MGRCLLFKFEMIFLWFKKQQRFILEIIIFLIVMSPSSWNYQKYHHTKKDECTTLRIELNQIMREEELATSLSKRATVLRIVAGRGLEIQGSKSPSQALIQTGLGWTHSPSPLFCSFVFRGDLMTFTSTNEKILFIKLNFELKESYKTYFKSLLGVLSAPIKILFKMIRMYNV